jgi:hypothetical protein
MAAYRTRRPSVLRRIPLVMMMLPFVVTAAVRPPCQETNPPSLAQILEKAAAYCRLFESASLNYVCVEDVRQTLYVPYLIAPGRLTALTRIVHNHLVYDYQLVGVGENISEQRKLLEKNGIRQNAPAAPSKIARFFYQYIILGPLILSEDQQRYHDYKIAGRGKLGKDKCAILEAVPKPSAPTGRLFGKVWVSERDGRVLKLEWYQESIKNYESFLDTAAALRAKPQIGLTMEYSFEHEGIGFPSRCRMSEDYIRDATRDRLIVSETTVTYKNYKFFTVETEVRTQ